MQNVTQITSNVIASMSSSEQADLLAHYVSNETAKKLSEINKNHTNEAKKQFALDNVEADLRNRLMKKITVADATEAAPKAKKGKKATADQLEALVNS